MVFKKRKRKRPRRRLDPSEIQELVIESKQKENDKINEDLNAIDNEVEPSNYDKLLKYYNVKIIKDDFEDVEDIKINHSDYENHNLFNNIPEKISLISNESINDGNISSFNKEFKQFKSDCGIPSIADPITIEPPGFEQYKSKKFYPFIDKLLKKLSKPTINLPKILVKQLTKIDFNNEFDSFLSKYNIDKSQTLEEQLNSQEFVTLFTSLSHYADVLYTDLNYLNIDIIRLCYCLHILSHIIQHRNNIINNTAKNNDSTNDEFDRDQGFTRPTVLILLPTKSSAFNLINIFSKFLPVSKKHADKFQTEFNISEENIEEQYQHFIKTKKPFDFIQIFNGDIDDCFRIGIKYENGLLHLFSPFYKSDIIIASPLGLRGVVASSDVKVKDYDFLSSIEVLLIDSANVIQFQNWSILLQVLDTINKPLKKLINSDIRRLRTSYIDGFASYYRQNIVISSNPAILLNDLFNKSNNCRGLIKLGKPSIESSLKLAKLLKINQVFIKIDCDSISNSFNSIIDAFKLTIDSLLPISKLVVVVQDYSHYLQIRESLDYAQAQYKVCHEYSSNKKLSSSRRDFFHGDCKMLVTTFRFIFFKRYVLRGGNYAIILGPPEYPPVYNHVLLSLSKNDGKVLCYYTKYSGLSLKNLFGQSTAVKLLSSVNGIPNILT